MGGEHVDGDTPEHKASRESSAPINSQDLDRPVSAKLFVWALGAAIAGLTTVLGTLVTTGLAFNRELDDVRDQVKHLAPEVDALHGKVEGMPEKLQAQIEHRMPEKLEERLVRIEEHVFTTGRNPR